jgi:nucleotide-binding universal stress UspA family protein
MQQFSKILVAVDVTDEEFGAADGPGSAVVALAEVVNNLRRLQDSPGQLTVMTVLAEGLPEASAVEAAARRSLDEHFVARLEGDAEVVIKFGVPFLEVTRSVLREEHDLVAVAARHSENAEGEPGIVSQMGTQLIRKCPCPVLVAPRKTSPLGEGVILAAVGFQHGLSGHVVRLSASIAQLTEREWHVLHVPEYPLEGGMRLRGASAVEVQSYENECREKAWKELHELTDDLALKVGIEPKLWMAEGRPSQQIAVAESQLDARLIVLGTIGRGGLAGVIIGNTAERTITRIKSAVLAVKPDDFICPVTL